LSVSFWIKLAFIIVEIILAVCFGVLTFKNHQQQAAVFEWVIALIFTFWVLSFLVDLLPAMRNWHHSGAGAPQIEMGEGSGGMHVVDDNGPSQSYSNGYGNGHSNGHSNGHKKYTNGYSNGR